MVQLDAELKSDLEANYFLVKRGKLFSLIGSAVGALAALGLVSYSGAMTAVNSSAGQDAAADIQKLLEQSTRDSEAIKAILESVRSGYRRVEAGHVKLKVEPQLEDQPAKSLERKQLGKVPFDRAFSQPPKIAVALRAFDLPDNSPRVRIETTPRADGFDYSVETWNVSTINSLSFDWVAVGVP